MRTTPFRVFAGVSALVAIAAFPAAPTGAQTYPSKPVKLVVPFAPGGATDIIGRLA